MIINLFKNGYYIDYNNSSKYVSWSKSLHGVEVYGSEWYSLGGEAHDMLVISADIIGIDLTYFLEELTSEVQIRQIKYTQEVVAQLPQQFKIEGIWRSREEGIYSL